MNGISQSLERVIVHQDNLMPLAGFVEKSREHLSRAWYDMALATLVRAATQSIARYDGWIAGEIADAVGEISCQVELATEVYERLERWDDIVRPIESLRDGIAVWNESLSSNYHLRLPEELKDRYALAQSRQVVRAQK